MSATKKYKLFSMNPNGGKPVCAFFSSPAGCRNGDKCTFVHTTGETNPVTEISETSSVISSESEGKIPMKAEKPARSAGDGEGKQARKNKRKSAPIANDHDDDDDDLFATPGKPTKPQAEDNTPSKRQRESTTPNKKQTPTNTRNKKQRQTKSEGAKTADEKETSNPATDFRSFVMGLPVASFSIGGASNSSVKKEERNLSTDLSPSKKDGGLPLPTSTEVGRKWQKAVLASREHERYASSFDFDKYKEVQKEAGIESKWIAAKSFGKWCAKNPQAVAIDCEMCETQDPLSKAKNAKALCRISVVNAEKPDEVLLDSLVKPVWPVTDHRTRINGISKQDLENVEFTLRHAQAFMMALCSEETVIVGHAVQNDLVALDMEHHCIADSSFLFRDKEASSSSVSLKDSVKSIFQQAMPDTHDSVNDARKALECVLHWVAKDGNVGPIERTSRFKGDQLFVHRVPKQCKTQHLSKMFLKHATIEPTEVDEIEFAGKTGKTHVTFKSQRHANLAFESLEGVADEDASGRLQKKVYLRSGDYVRVRKMVTKRRDTYNGNSNQTPQK